MNDLLIFMEDMMSFRENLKRKIEIKRLRNIIEQSICQPGSKKIDKTSVKQMLAMGPFEYVRKRDLDLFLFSEGKILVLDNELTIYNSTLDDVVLRKSPTLKEMVKIRNAIKILNDSDVVVSKREKSLKIVYSICLDQLDLNWAESDIADMHKEANAALELGYDDRIIEMIILFSELLNFTEAPEKYKMEGYYLAGNWSNRRSCHEFGPVLVYGKMTNKIFLFEKLSSSEQKTPLQAIRNVLMGKEHADHEGKAVFEKLTRKVLENK